MPRLMLNPKPTRPDKCNAAGRRERNRWPRLLQSGHATFLKGFLVCDAHRRRRQRQVRRGVRPARRTDNELTTDE